jgi:hypothetical protein
MIELDFVKVLSGGLEAALLAVDRRPNHPHLVLDQRPLRCAAPCTSATRLHPNDRRQTSTARLVEPDNMHAWMSSSVPLLKRYLTSTHSTCPTRCARSSAARWAT